MFDLIKYILNNIFYSTSYTSGEKLKNIVK